jgi:SPP1 family predicted phage head-tail adaptor
MNFDISKLDKRITIQRQVKTGTDAMGGFITDWTDVCRVFAAIWPKSAKELVKDQQPMGEITHRIRVRYRRGVTAQCRVKYKNRYFNITGIVNPDEDNEWLDLLCKEVG